MGFRGFDSMQDYCARVLAEGWTTYPLGSGITWDGVFYEHPDRWDVEYTAPGVPIPVGDVSGDGWAADIALAAVVTMRQADVRGAYATPADAVRDLDRAIEMLTEVRRKLMEV